MFLCCGGWSSEAETSPRVVEEREDRQVETAAMAWRFQASKFKNTTPKQPKKEDTVFDLPIGNLSCTNNGIQASHDYLAFHIEGEGGKLGVVPVGSKGRRLRKDISVVCAHGDLIDDFSFMPFASDALVTCSRDDKLKLWRLSGDSSVLETSVDVGNGVLLEALKPHSTAAGLVAVAANDSCYLVDLEQGKVAAELTGITDKGQCLDWSPDGKLLAVSADKGRQVCVFDPRTGSDPIQTLAMHQGMGREGRVLFCGDRLLSSGFTNKRVQEVRLLDTNKWGAPIHTQEFVSTTGVLIPHFDPDTRLVFLAGKGTNKMFLMEMQDRQPLMSQVYETTLAEQTLGSCLGSKRNMRVMDAEVDVFYQLTKHSIVPVSCTVPRRSYRDFHAELFPDTLGGEAGCTAAEWLGGADKMPAKVSLSPDGVSSPSPPPQEPTPPRQMAATTPTTTATVTPPEPAAVAPVKNTVKSEVDEPSPPPPATAPEVRELDYNAPKSDKMEEGYDLLTASTAPVRSEPIMTSSPEKAPEKAPEIVVDQSHSKENDKPKEVSPAPAPLVKLRSNTAGDSGPRPLSTRVRPKSCVVGQVASKFRHLETLVGIKAKGAVFSNLRNVNTRLSPESNGACASGMFVAVPLSGPAGVVGIYDVDEPGKLPDGVMDGVFNKAQVTDLEWNPFNDGQLAVGTDVGLVHIWNLSREDGPRNEMEPAVVLRMHGEKVLTLRWHPVASDLLAVALSDHSIEIWDTKKAERRTRIVSHSASVLSLSWSVDGRQLVSVGKDAMLNIHQPQLGPDCLIRQKKVLDSTRAARVLFVCDDRAVVVVGFTKGSGRQVQLIDAYSLTTLYTLQIDNATQPLVPYYDYDSSVLFLSGKGDRILNMYEVCYDSPFLLQLTPYMAAAGSQTIAFHNKKRCDVMAVEFQRGWRLTEKTLEQMIFRVPRVKKDVFQSDLFPDALVTWQPALTGEEWLAGDERPPMFTSLKPDGVNSLAGSTARAAPSRLAKRSDFPDPEITADGAAKKEVEAKVEASWSSQIVKDTRLEQDRMEGVAEEEWA